MIKNGVKRTQDVCKYLQKEYASLFKPEILSSNQAHESNYFDEKFRCSMGTKCQSLSSNKLTHKRKSLNKVFHMYDQRN